MRVGKHDRDKIRWEEQTNSGEGKKIGKGNRRREQTE